MALDSNTYGTVEGVETLVGDVAKNATNARQFSATTVPTETQVEGILDDVAAEMNNWLKAHNYSAKIDSVADEFAYKYTAKANNHGAAAVILSTVPNIAFDPSPSESKRISKTRAEMHQAFFNTWKETVKNGDLDATMDTSLGDLIISGASQNSDGDNKKPLFTRDMDAHAGTREFTE